MEWRCSDLIWWTGKFHYKIDICEKNFKTLRDPVSSDEGSNSFRSFEARISLKGSKSSKISVSAAGARGRN